MIIQQRPNDYSPGPETSLRYGESDQTHVAVEEAILYLCM